MPLYMLDVLFSSIFPAIISKWDKALYTKAYHGMLNLWTVTTTEQTEQGHVCAPRETLWMLWPSKIMMTFYSPAAWGPEERFIFPLSNLERGGRKGRMIYPNKEGLNNIVRHIFSAICNLYVAVQSPFKSAFGDHIFIYLWGYFESCRPSLAWS